ncbi:hypothetical protein BKA80DRAFT_275613 [Phyllosticta citrichinensis]
MLCYLNLTKTPSPQPAFINQTRRAQPPPSRNTAWLSSAAHRPLSPSDSKPTCLTDPVVPKPPTRARNPPSLLRNGGASGSWNHDASKSLSSVHVDRSLAFLVPRFAALPASPVSCAAPPCPQSAREPAGSCFRKVSRVAPPVFDDSRTHARMPARTQKSW